MAVVRPVFLQLSAESVSSGCVALGRRGLSVLSTGRAIQWISLVDFLELDVTSTLTMSYVVSELRLSISLGT